MKKTSSKNDKMKSMKKIGPLICAAFAALQIGCEQPEATGSEQDTQELIPNNEAVGSVAYEEALAISLREQKANEPKFEVEIDLGQQRWTGGISHETLLSEGFADEGGYLQGNVLLNLKLTSGKEIQERCSDLSVERDAKGIKRVRFDAYERFTLAEVEAHLPRLWEVFKAEGMKQEVFETQQEEIMKWLARPDDGKSSSAGLSHDGKDGRVFVRFSQFFDRTLGIGLRYTFEPYRIGETKWEKKLKNER